MEEREMNWLQKEITEEREMMAKGFSNAQIKMLRTEPRLMEARPEAGYVIPIHGSAQHRTARALEAKGAAKLFYIAPYDNAFIRITE